MAIDFVSIRTMLEDQRIGDTDLNLQFLGAVVTSYPCLDIWVGPSKNDREVQIRVWYMQKDSGFIATEPWERNGEAPKHWRKFTGNWDAVKSWFIEVLPSLSRLHEDKRHGLQNYGGQNPYEGGGLVADVNEQGDLEIVGRFGIINVTLDGVRVPFSEIAFDFDGCEVTATVPGNGGNFQWNNRPVDRTIPTDYGDTTPIIPTARVQGLTQVGGYDSQAPFFSGPFPTIPAQMNWTSGPGTLYPPPTFLSPTFLPNALLDSNTAPAGAVYPRSELSDSFHCKAQFNSGPIPMISEQPDGSRVYEGPGTCVAVTWVLTPSTYETNATAYQPTVNRQGVASGGTATVDGTWTITRNKNGNNWDISWSFIPDDPAVNSSCSGSATNVNASFGIGTNGFGAVNDMGGLAALGQAQLGNVVDVPGSFSTYGTTIAEEGEINGVSEEYPLLVVNPTRVTAIAGLSHTVVTTL